MTLARQERALAALTLLACTLGWVLALAEVFG